MEGGETIGDILWQRILIFGYLLLCYYSDTLDEWWENLKVKIHAKPYKILFVQRVEIRNEVIDSLH